jgi:hypothetical protein
MRINLPRNPAWEARGKSAIDEPIYVDARLP